jgi:hypothetical protein
MTLEKAKQVCTTVAAEMVHYAGVETIVREAAYRNLQVITRVDWEEMGIHRQVASFHRGRRDAPWHNDWWARFIRWLAWTKVGRWLHLTRTALYRFANHFEEYIYGEIEPMPEDALEKAARQILWLRLEQREPRMVLVGSRALYEIQRGSLARMYEFAYQNDRVLFKGIPVVKSPFLEPGAVVVTE